MIHLDDGLPIYLPCSIVIRLPVPEHDILWKGVRLYYAIRDACQRMACGGAVVRVNFNDIDC